MRQVYTSITGGSSTSERNSTKGSEPSFLDGSKEPMRSWKHVIRQNHLLVTVTSARGGPRGWPCCSTNPDSVTLSSMVHEFRDEQLSISAWVFFCGVCTEEHSQRSIIFNHSASVKCKHSKTKGRAERRILLRLWQYTTARRGFALNAGVLLSKMDCIPQQNASGLTDRRGMSDQVIVKKGLHS